MIVQSLQQRVYDTIRRRALHLSAIADRTGLTANQVKWTVDKLRARDLIESAGRTQGYWKAVDPSRRYPGPTRTEHQRNAAVHRWATRKAGPSVGTTG